MSDEIKKIENEAPKVEPSAELSEPALDEVVGGAKSTPLLFKACATGEHIKTATIVC